MTSTIICPLHSAARRWGDAVAIDGPEGKLSYADLDTRVGALAQSWAEVGVKPGDHIGLLGENRLETLLSLLAAIRLGAVWVPLSPRFPESLLQQLSQELSIHWACGEFTNSVAGLSSLSAAITPGAPQVWRVDSDKPVSLILTSGSSGHPKAAMHNLAHHLASAEGSFDQTPLARGDAWLLSLPLFHIGGVAIVFRCLSAGATMVLPKHGSLDAELEHTPITHVSLVATQLKRLLESPNSDSLLSKLKVMLLGGGPIPAPLLEAIQGYPFKALTSYGMTEMGSQITTGPANAQGLSGFPLAGRQVRIVDDVIEVRGDCRFLGYYANKKLTKPFDKDGWFVTRDRGRWIGEQLQILGRVDNMFISGGENVQPEAIEAVLKKSPGVEEAVVVPVADKEFGFLPVALVKGDWTEEALEKRVRKKLPRFMRPRSYISWPKDLESKGLKVSRVEAAKYIGGLDIGFWSGQ